MVNHIFNASKVLKNNIRVLQKERISPETLTEEIILRVLRFKHRFENFPLFQDKCVYLNIIYNSFVFKYCKHKNITFICLSVKL